MPKKSKLKKDKKHLYLASGIALFLLIVGIVFGWSTNNEHKPEEALNPDAKPNINVQQIKVEHPLTGQLVSKEEIGFPISVIIDNISFSRPPSGLEKALNVYECPVEGNITRYLAIFDSSDLPSKIGPIRSARPYFIDFAEEYGNIFIHAGGSPQALSQLEQTSLYNLDEIKKGDYFYRDNQRQAPYNLYTSKELIEKFIEDKNISLNFSLSFEPWLYSQDEKNWPFHGPEINITFYEDVIWQYDDKEEVYIRSKDGFQCNNLIILKTDIEVIDQIDRRFIRTDGEGEALFFEKGKMLSGWWKKENGRTKFYEKNGQEVSLIPGKTWIEVVSSETVITY